MPVRRRLVVVARGLGLTTSLAACAAEPQRAATSRVTTEPAPAAAAPVRAAVSAACTTPPEVSARRVADFSLLHGRERIGMAYVVRTRRGTGCRVVTSIAVTKPIQAWENTAPPTAGNVGCGPR